MDAKTLERLLNQIAAEHLHIDTLATRNSDRLDFHDTAVWCIRDALEAAFKAGAEVGASLPKARTMSSRDTSSAPRRSRSAPSSAFSHPCSI